MKISVIMPVYNREIFVATAIKSLLRQSGDAEFDIIVVDDGSTDTSAEIVASISEANPAVRLFSQPKGGIARARNRGLAELPDDCELVSFLDSDDVSVSGRFAAELPLFRDNQDLALTYSKMTLADAIDAQALTPQPGAISCTLHGISLTTAIFRRNVIARLDGFDERLTQSEDWDFLVRFFELKLKYLLLDHVAILYRRHPGNTTRDVERGKRDFLKVVLMSAQRRRINPSLGSIPKFFDLSPLFDDRYAMLR